MKENRAALPSLIVWLSVCIIIAVCQPYLAASIRWVSAGICLAGLATSIGMSATMSREVAVSKFGIAFYQSSEPLVGPRQNQPIKQESRIGKVEFQESSTPLKKPDQPPPEHPVVPNNERQV